MSYTCPNCRRTWPLTDKDFPVFCFCGYLAKLPSDMSLPVLNGPVQLPAVHLGPPCQPCPGSPVSIGRGDYRKPGTALHYVLASIDIYPTKDCPCIELMNLMDEWGPEGCQERREEIVIHLRTEHKKWGWGALLRHAAKAMRTGLAFKLDPLDPASSLVDIAINRSLQGA